jgi:hypothetical protein
VLANSPVDTDPRPVSLSAHARAASVGGPDRATLCSVDRPSQPRLGDSKKGPSGRSAGPRRLRSAPGPTHARGPWPACREVLVWFMPAGSSCRGAAGDGKADGSHLGTSHRLRSPTPTHCQGGRRVRLPSGLPSETTGGRPSSLAPCHEAETKASVGPSEVAARRRPA